MTGYERKLNQVVDEIFRHFERTWTYADIASKAKLAISTVWKIENRITKLPRFKTVYALAKAAGFELGLSLIRELRKAI